MATSMITNPLKVLLRLNLKEIVTKSNIVFLNAVKYDVEATYINHPLKPLVGIPRFGLTLLKEGH